MVIDFHTHAFPANIAAKATSKNYIKPILDGSYDSLSQSMTTYGIDRSLILPVSTKEGMSEGLNIKAAKISEITGDTRLLSFGSIFPGENDWPKLTEQVKELGLKGIKIQPSFQNCILSDKKVFDLVNYALSIGLYVLIHVGPDYPKVSPECSTPKMAANMLTLLNDCSRLIFAHLGGYNYPMDAYEYVAGSGCYLDTSMCTEAMGKDTMYRIIKKHGSDRVLFGSDSPWYSQGQAIEDIKSLNLSKEELDKILYKNASQILQLSI